MPKRLARIFSAIFLAAAAPAAPAHATAQEVQAQMTNIDFISVGADLRLRRMVLSNPDPKGVVLLLHGFPETLSAWQGVAQPLAEDYEVHAFDWPGFGLSSRPPVEHFSYSPRDFARVLKAYIDKAGIDRSKLTIYATDIGALPALLLALDEPGIAARILVGDFAPFDRPHLMYESLQALKSPASSEKIRAFMNSTRDEILANAHRRGLPEESQFELSAVQKEDMLKGWTAGNLTSADAFHHYYSHFTRDQDFFEANLGRLKTPVKVVWGEKDLYIKKEMGLEFAKRIGAEVTLLPEIGHYPHLQAPKHTIEAIRNSFR